MLLRGLGRCDATTTTGKPSNGDKTIACINPHKCIFHQKPFSCVRRWWNFSIFLLRRFFSFSDSSIEIVPTAECSTHHFDFLP